MSDFLQLNQTRVDQLREAYVYADMNGQVTFNFQGNEMYTPYAYYLLVHARDNLGFVVNELPRPKQRGHA